MVRPGDMAVRRSEVVVRPRLQVLRPPPSLCAGESYAQRRRSGWHFHRSCQMKWRWVRSPRVTR